MPAVRPFGEIPFAAVASDDELRGTLGERPLPELLEQLGQAGLTGTVRIGEGSAVHLDGGRIYLATTPSSTDVANVLFGAGTATLDEIRALLAAPAGDAAGALADQHPDAAGTLDRLLHEYNLSALFEMIVPSDAGFEIVEGDRHPVGSRFSEAASELVAQADRRLTIWKQIAVRIPSTAATFALAEALPDGDDERLVTADEWRYLSLLDGHRSVADVINATGESAFRVCSSLYRLLLEGLVREIES